MARGATRRNWIARDGCCLRARKVATRRKAMKPLPACPSLYQINTRVLLTELSRVLGRPATLDDIPDVELDRLTEMGFDWIWLLSVWQTGMAAQTVSRSNTEWRKDYENTLPDLRDEDIAGSGLSITGYTVNRALGGDAALARLRTRMGTHGLRLLLDFVPNHMAPDHPWVEQHPDYFVHGSEIDLANSPQNYCRVKAGAASRVLAYDRLREGHAQPVREHLHAGLDYQNKLARFLENHDEPRAAATFSAEVHQAAAVITFLSPGLRFFHQGQFEGCRKRISPHLCRGPDEPIDQRLKEFYDRLLSALRHPAVCNGQWHLLECVPAWEGNWTRDCFVAFAWQGPDG